MATPSISFDKIASYIADLKGKVHETGFKSTPFVQNFKELKTGADIGTKAIWLKKVLRSSIDFVGVGGITNIATTLPIVGSTASNPVVYNATTGTTELIIAREKMGVTAQPTPTSLTVVRGIKGTTAVAHLAGAKIYIKANAPIGSGKTNRNDARFSEREFNFISNQQYELNVSLMELQGRMKKWGDVNEASPEHQMKELKRLSWENMEACAFYDTRYEGTPTGVSTSAVTFTSGQDASAGGLSEFITLHGGLTPDSANNPITLANLQNDVEDLRARGAFNSVMDTEVGAGNALLFCGSGVYKALQNQLAAGRMLSATLDVKEFGLDIRRYDINGVSISIKQSDFVNKGEYFIVPNDKDKFAVEIYRLVEPTLEVPDMDQKSIGMSTTWSYRFGNASIALRRVGIAE